MPDCARIDRSGSTQTVRNHLGNRHRLIWFRFDARRGIPVLDVLHIGFMLRTVVSRRHGPPARMLSRALAPVRAMCSAPRTLYDKVWDDHVIANDEGGASLVFIDRHLVHEVPTKAREAHKKHW